MRIVSANDIVTENGAKIKLVSEDQIVEEFFPHVKFLRDEIEEFYGARTMPKDNGKSFVNPVFAEFRRVQALLDELGASNKSPGQQRRISVKLVNDFRGFLRDKNIRHRNLWRNLKVKD